MKTVSMGFFREDGDFQLLSTLNNNDELLSNAEFQELIHSVWLELAKYSFDERIEILWRQDAPDYVTIEDAI